VTAACLVPSFIRRAQWLAGYPIPVKAGKQGESSFSGSDIYLSYSEKSIYIRYLREPTGAKEQGQIFVDQGAPIGLSGGQQETETRRRFIGFEARLLRKRYVDIDKENQS